MDSGPDEPARLCPGCSYRLDGLLENRCPECGRPFDPTDPGTFRIDQRSNRWGWNMLLGPSPVSAVLFLVLFLILSIALLLALLFLRC